MRDIKFRAWDLDNFAMYYTDESKNDSEVNIVWMVENNKFIFKEWQLIDRLVGGYHEQEEDFVAPKQVLMQYTGLKDKNGVEIYEGDILKFEDSIVGSIEFGYNGFNLTGESCITNFDAERELEVVGNIYNTPNMTELRGLP